MEEQYLICRTCFEVVINNNFRFIDDLNDVNSVNTAINIREMLQLCVPELDFYVSTQPIICNDCYETLNNFYSFKNKCIETETKIQAYIKFYNLMDYNQVNLNCVVQVTKNTSLENTKNLVSINNGNDVFIKNHLIGFNAPCNFPDVPEPYYHNVKEVPMINSLERNTYYTNNNPLPSEISSKDLDEILLSCKYCPYITTNPLSLNEHDCPEAKKYSCDICPYKSKTSYQLKKHKNSLHTITTWSYCNQCDYKTTDTSILRRHQKCHQRAAEKTILKCHICSYVTYNEFLFNKHIMRHQENSNRPYCCEFCSYQTNDKSNFKKHVYIHADVPIMCKVCLYQCPSPYQMRKHVKRNHIGLEYDNIVIANAIPTGNYLIGHNSI